MRATDDRYKGEKDRFELAMRMIGLEARTGTIRFWTGLGDDRVRKLYTSYFKYRDTAIKRRRGRSPTQIGPLVCTPTRTLESGVLANLMVSNGLMSTERPPGPELKHNVELGHRFCECFETYRILIPNASLSFEWSWNLLLNVRRADELGIVRCEHCGVYHVLDLLALPQPPCPCCSTILANPGNEQQRLC